MRAVITAGGLVDEAFANAIGTRVKALAPFGTRTLLDVALDACEGAGIDGVAVIGGAEIRAHLAGAEVRVIDAALDGGTNVLRALDAWPGERFVYLTSDMPFASAGGVRDLIARSDGFGVTMAVADVAAYEARFPGAAEHSVTLGGERVANGNAFVIGAEAVAPARALATKLFAARKSLVRLALLLGPSLCLKFATKRLSIADLEAYGRRRLGVPVGALRGCDPGLCYDVDTLPDYEYALAHVQARG
ncbi:MAG TPA: NTP transferase domain-containing protein [Candidatus Elarobacter sp.]|jgi:CTP:molybdopterin cytidylyltransferase MocA|nr:NTP transferase domain-containing protein [Candidatus Elarobacter sp.]